MGAIRLKRYKKEYPDNEFTSEIDKAIDTLFFDLPNTSSEEKHAHYADLLERYPGQELAKMALKAEVDLSFKEKKYGDILKLRGLIADLNESKVADAMNAAALNLANNHNQSSDCIDLIALIDEYGLEDKISDKLKLFNCYDRMRRYTQAYNLAEQHLNESNLNNRVVWLNNFTKINYKITRYTNAIDTSFKAVQLASKVPYSDPSEAIVYRFYSLLKLDRFDEAVSALKSLEGKRGLDLMLIEAYDTAMNYADQNGLKSAAIDYAIKVLNLQKKLNINTFSPEANFIYIDSLVSKDKLQEAKNEIEALFTLNLKSQNRARALHKIAQVEISQNNLKEAAKYVNECLEIAGDSQWRGLCLEQKQLVDGI